MTEGLDDDFVREHEPLVRKHALRVRAQLDLTTDVEELMAYGYRGLVEAKQRFDATRGVQFTTFAYYRVRGAILDGVRDMAYLPRRAHANRKAAEALDREAEAVGEAHRSGGSAMVAASAIDDILTKTCAAYVISVVGQDEPTARADEALIQREDHDRVHAALEVLDERERTLVEGYYLNDRTLEEMGKEMGISKSWASRICSKALGKMRDALEKSA